MVVSTVVKIAIALQAEGTFCYYNSLLVFYAWLVGNNGGLLVDVVDYCISVWWGIVAQS